ncbi:MAG TPA: hypothetical protein V6D17_25355, partial [Candidatus Obscuribacterales bacterium]
MELRRPIASCRIFPWKGRKLITAHYDTIGRTIPLNPTCPWRKVTAAHYDMIVGQLTQAQVEPLLELA